MLLYSSPTFLNHQTTAHPERAERLVAIHQQLEQTGLDQKCTRPAWGPISCERLALVHDLGYAATVEHFAHLGGGRIEADTLVSAASYDVALFAAGAVCDAVDRLVRGEDRRALCLVRPPGHHALPAGAMGFCLFNNVALAAAVATQQHGLDRVLIVDWDVHHGNGTQEAFYQDPRVGFLSIHRWPFYPGTGDEDETGTGPGLGFTCNLPLKYGTPREVYLDHFRRELERFASKIRPQLVFISAGFDAHFADPIGSLDLEVEDFDTLTEFVLNVADVHAGGRVISALEGGYNVNFLGQCVEAHLRRMLQREA